MKEGASSLRLRGIPFGPSTTQCQRIRDLGYGSKRNDWHCEDRTSPKRGRYIEKKTRNKTRSSNDSLSTAPTQIDIFRQSQALEELTDVLLLRQSKLILALSRAGTSIPLMLLDITAPQLWNLRTQRRCAIPNTWTASRARSATPLPEHKTETPASTRAGAGDR